ncbi:MAG: NUDIX domain-containing protein [Defluviitaleaceae bacterium]|nr:NUDIX domain-containing protein [Defluviitaleaceae bacterium]
MADKSIYFAAKALIIHDGRFLAMHKTQNASPCYELPGGTMEFGETAEQTVVREVFEETKLRATPVKLLDTWNYVGENSQFTGVIYLCNVENPVDFAMSDEHDCYEWLTPCAESFAKMLPLFRPQLARLDWASILAMA